MKRALVVALGVALTPIPASALPIQTVYNAVIPDGKNPADASNLGLWFVDFDSDTGSACRYRLEWNDNFGAHALSTDCYLDETKPHGDRNCVRSESLGVPTLLQLAEDQPCQGIDTTGQIHSIYQLIAGEERGTGHLFGLIQFSASSLFLYAFEGVPYP